MKQRAASVVVSLAALLVLLIPPTPSLADAAQCSAPSAGCVPVIIIDGVGVPVDAVTVTEATEASAPDNGRIIDAYHWKYGQATIEYGFIVNGQLVPVGQLLLGASIGLNGRQSNWDQTSKVFTGPAVSATHHWNCVDDNGGLPNTECNEGTGAWPSHDDPSYRTGTWESTASNYHSDASTYWYDHYWTWSASGYSGSWRLPNSHFSSAHFSCPRSPAICTFPA